VTVTVTPDATGFGDDFRLRLLDIPRAAAPPAPPAAPRPPRPARPPSVFNDWFYSDGPMTSLSGRGRLGITMESLDGQLAEYFGVKEGALVKSVVDDSAAAKAGIKAGDVITSFNGTRVYDASDVSRAINRMDGPGDFTVEIVRDRKTQTLKGKLEARQTRASRSRARTEI
jgi:membrane-associated protease RseP (regulator of RpoE activity)